MTGGFILRTSNDSIVDSDIGRSVASIIGAGIMGYVLVGPEIAVAIMAGGVVAELVYAGVKRVVS